MINGPPPEDLASTTNSYIEVLLTATDSWGLSATVTENVDPETVDLTFVTNPAGLDLKVAGETISPGTVTMWDGWTTTIEAPDQVDGGLPWAWTSWSPPGAQAHEITVGATATTQTANFAQTTRIVPGAASISEGDAGTMTLDLPVTLTVPSTQTVTATWQTVDVSAEDPDDYLGASGSVTFVPGDTYEEVSITVVDDNIHEGDENFLVQFANPVNAILGGIGGAGIATIVEDESLPTIKPIGVLVNPEGDTGSTIHNIVVQLSHPSSTPITADYASLDIPANPTIAASGSDYVGPFNGVVTFAPGETTQTVPVEILGDTVDEPPTLWGEWGLVGFSNPSANATLDISFFGLALFIIIDDDP